MLTDLFGAHPEVRILEFLAHNREFDYTISEISRGSGVSRPATYKVIERFLETDVVRRTRRMGASTFYRLHEENALVKPFVDLELDLSAGPRAKRRLPARRNEPQGRG